MIKRISIFIATLLVVFFTAYFLHKTYIDNNEVVQSFSLLNIYLFQIIASIVVYILSEMALTKIPNEAGYLFLFLTMVQSGIFFFVFRDHIFTEESLNKITKFSFIIPMFLSLILEVTAVVKMLNNKEFDN